MSSLMLVVLGTAQDAGIPHVGCGCATCGSARLNLAQRRLASSLAVLDKASRRWLLIDATPDFPAQLERMAARLEGAGSHGAPLMDGVVLTHAHIGHYTGLMYLGREAIGTRGIPIYAGSGLRRFLAENGPWSQLVRLQNIALHELDPDLEASFPGFDELSITPVSVPHRNEYSATFGLLIAGPRHRVLYIPDIDRWEQWDRDLAEMAKQVDVCLLDGTFYDAEELAERGRSYDEVPHPLVTDTMERLRDVVESGTTKVYFTHLNHTNRALRADPRGTEAVADIAQRGCYIASENAEFPL